MEAKPTVRQGRWTAYRTSLTGAANQGSIVAMEFSVESTGAPRGSRETARGFTLLELMVTLSLAGLLLGIGVPMFRDTIAGNRLTGQANDLVAAITMARSQAITANQRVVFCRSASDAAAVCAGSNGSWEFWLIVDASGSVVRRGDIPTHGGAIAVSSTLTNDQVTFDSEGLARTNGVLVSNHRIVVCSNHSATNNQRRITMGAGSRVSTTRVSGGC